MSIKIYVASKFEDAGLVKEVGDKLNKAGFEVMTTWTNHPKLHPYSENLNMSRTCAYEDIDNISECDIFILLYNGKKGPGMFFELGYATSLLLNEKIHRVVMIGEDVGDSTIFAHIDNIELMSDIEEFIVTSRYNAC